LTHHNLTDKEIKNKETATEVEQGNSGVESLPAMQDIAVVEADEKKLQSKKTNKKKGGGKKGSGYTGLNKFRTDMQCSSCSRSMVQTGAITTDELTITKKIPLRADGKSPFKPIPGVGNNKALAVVCDDCIRQSKSPEQGGTNMPITYKTLVLLTNEGRVVNIPVNTLQLK
jgi:hypothetical protein